MLKNRDILMVLLFVLRLIEIITIIEHMCNLGTDDVLMRNIFLVRTAVRTPKIPLLFKKGWLWAGVVI